VAKRGRPIVLGPLTAPARAAIEAVAGAVGARVVDAEALAGPLPLAPRLAGPHQLANARVAAALALAGRDRLPLADAAIVRGIAGAEWPGRLERIDARGRRFLLDAAHNLDGARALVAAAPSLGLDPARTVLIFGALADKPYRELLACVAPLAHARIYACPLGRAPAPLAELAAVAAGDAATDAADAIGRAVARSGPADLVLVTGSLYLVGAVRAQLLGITPDPVVGL